MLRDQLLRGLTSHDEYQRAFAEQYFADLHDEDPQVVGRLIVAGKQYGWNATVSLHGTSFSESRRCDRHLRPDADALSTAISLALNDPDPHLVGWLVTALRAADGDTLLDVESEIASIRSSIPEETWKLVAEKQRIADLDDESLNRELVDTAAERGELDWDNARWKFAGEPRESLIGECLRSRGTLSRELQEQTRLLINRHAESIRLSAKQGKINEFELTEAESWMIDGCIEALEPHATADDVFALAALCDAEDDYVLQASIYGLVRLGRNRNLAPSIVTAVRQHTCEGDRFSNLMTYGEILAAAECDEASELIRELACPLETIDDMWSLASSLCFRSEDDFNFVYEQVEKYTTDLEDAAEQSIRQFVGTAAVLRELEHPAVKWADATDDFLRKMQRFEDEQPNDIASMMAKISHRLGQDRFAESTGEDFEDGFFDDSGFDDTPYPIATTIINETAKVGRNEPCLCGSGKKFKKCCGKG